MLRRLEKGLNNAKLKSHQPQPTPGTQALDQVSANDPTFTSGEHFSAQQRPHGTFEHDTDYPGALTADPTTTQDEDDDDPERNKDGLFPAKMIHKERDRNSFFRTILNPDDQDLPASSVKNAYSPSPLLYLRSLKDPVANGLIDENQAKVFFDALFIRLNPFINLFDPELHTVEYVRGKCPFLFTTLIMAGCKFFRPELFKECRKVANEYALLAFAEGWKSVEVVQAFACLTYWKEPEDDVR
jgi:hypothetical protein